MDSNAMAEMVDIVPFLETAVLSYNNFSKSDAPRALAEAILTSDCRLKASYLLYFFGTFPTFETSN